MYHIAIVDDEKEFTDQLETYLNRYQEENSVTFKISVFHDGTEILKDYQPVYDMILLDIEMPQINGMDAAEKIREQDSDVVLMFITNMASYAIHGYGVGALDFVMKPLEYYGFSMRFTRALKRAKQKENAQILLTLPDGVKKLKVQQIYFVEVQNRILHYYTDEGVYSMRGTMQSVEEVLGRYHFMKCNHWYIVNLMHVTEVQKNKVMVGGHLLEISRRSRAGFLEALASYVGGMRL